MSIYARTLRWCIYFVHHYRLTKTKFRSFGLYSHKNSWVALHGKAVAARTNFNSHVIVYSSQNVFNYI